MLHVNVGGACTEDVHTGADDSLDKLRECDSYKGEGGQKI